MLFTLQTTDKEQYGPVSLETLRAWAREGRIEKENLIYDHTSSKWIEAEKLAQLASFFHPQPTPAIPVAVTTAPDTRKLAPVKPLALHASDPNKSKITKELIRTDLPQTQGQAAQPKTFSGEAQANRPPTVLERITRLFVSPFLKKDPTEKKRSQRLK